MGKAKIKTLLRKNFVSGGSAAEIMTAEEAVSLIKDGDSIAIATFFSAGVALDLIDALVLRGTKRLKIFSNDTGLPGESTGKLIESGQVDSLTVSFIATNPEAEKLVTQGKLKVNLIPQGTLIEKFRATGSGIGGFYTPTGVGTEVEKGKEKKIINGKEYIFEEAFFPKPKFAFIKAWMADKKGNLIFRGAARNFNPAVAQAAEITIVEAENIVETGEIAPDEVMLPFNYVDILVQSSGRKVRPWEFKPRGYRAIGSTKEKIARRVAKELENGDVVNLGIGIPTLVANYIPKDVTVNLQAEPGVLGIGPRPQEGFEDPDIIDAGGNPITVLDGGAFFDSSLSFSMIRGGHIDKTVLGALQVDEKGNLANYLIPGKRAPGIGGGMDLAANAKRVIIATEHTTPDGQPKIVKKCSLPLTAKGAVNLIITELAVIKVTRRGLVLKEIAPGKTIKEVQALTEPRLIIAKNLKKMDV